MAALFRLEHSLSVEDMRQVLLRLGQWLADPQDAVLRRDFARFTAWLLRRKVRDTTIPDITDLQDIQHMLTERRLDWWEEWKREGLDEGRAKGLEQGRVEGRVEGEAQLLHRQLQRRFGELPGWVRDKLTHGTEEDLMRWGEGVVDAKTLDELFA